MMVLKYIFCQAALVTRYCLHKQAVVTSTRSFRLIILQIDALQERRMDGFEVRMYFIEILRKMNALVTSVFTSVPVTWR